MALNLVTNPTMASRITAPSAAYPGGSAKDETAPGAGDGSPYFKGRADDIFGMQQALLDEAAIVPNGNSDTVLSSQYRDAMKIILGGAGLYQSDINYLVDSRSKGSDGFLYKCIVANGPGSLVVDPVGDTTGKWIPAEPIGVLQTWQNVVGSRTNAVTYTNTTGRPIVVNMSISTVAGSTARFVVNGVETATAINNDPVNNVQSSLSSIVPDNGTYILNSTAGITIAAWAELRA